MIDKNNIIQALQEYAVLMEIQGENPFKIRAYENAGRILSGISEDIEFLIKQDRLTTIKGIGKGIADFIKEFITTGQSSDLNKLKKEIPAGILDMLRIPSMGPKKAKIILEKLHITSIGELEYACQENRLLDLEGFGEKTQAKILQGIQLLKKYADHHLLSRLLTEAEELQILLSKVEGIKKIALVGSLRRRREIIRNINILVITEKDLAWISKKISSALPIESHTLKGNVLTAGLQSGTQMILYLIPENQFSYALLYYTGSHEFNSALQSVARKHDYQLTENGLFRNGKNEVCKTEHEIFYKLGLHYIPVELRENRGEILHAQQNPIPQLVEESNLKGVIHVHSNYSDGVHSISELAIACQTMGYSYLVICDHSKSATYARGLNESRINEQVAEIDKLNQDFKNFRILKSIECDILTDGKLDYDDSILSKFDLVIASIHSKFNMNKAEATNRLLRAIENPFTTIIGHPTGRLLLAREGYPVDMEALLNAAADQQVAIELNANPHRLDLDWRYLLQAKEKGVKISINPDAHRIEGISDIRYGVYMARKGWLTASDVLNCMNWQDLLRFAQQRRSGSIH